MARSNLSHNAIHWRAPTTIIVTFVFGLVCAIGHHIFYSSLDGKLVDNELSSQQINIAIGTAFAFLLRASLSVSVGVSYWQVFWRKVLYRGKALPVAHLDSLAGSLASIFDLLNLRVLLAYRSLALLAVLSWLVPWAALLPPATLTVKNVSQTRHDFIDVPLINFTSTALMTAGSTTNADFVGMDPDVDANSDDQIYEPEKIYAWVEGVEHFKPGSASPRLIRHVTSVAMDGAIPSFPGVGINTTYTVQFPGPTVQCRPLPDIFLDKFRTYMERDCGGYTTTKSVVVGPFFNESITEKACGLDRAGFTYMSWLTSFGWFWSDMRPSFSVIQDRIEASTRLDSGDFRWFMVATKDWDPEFGNRSPDFKTSYGPWNVLNCSLHHAIYTVNVTSSASNISDIADYNVEVLGAVARPSP